MARQLTDDEQRQWKRVSRKRSMTIIGAALVSLLLAFTVMVGDLYDVIPGPLTVHDVNAAQVQRIPTLRSVTPVVSDADLTRSIDTAQAKQLIHTLQTADGVGKDISTVIMQADGTTIASLEANTVREPASTLKTLTALAAASKLDMGSTLHTQTFFVQESNGANMVILKGEGDMLLSTTTNDPTHINGRAGLLTLAQDTAHALQQRGITKITLAYDDSLFGQNRYPTDIAQNNSDNLYYTGVSSMAIDGGRDRGGTRLTDPDTFADYPELSQHTAQDAAQQFATLLGAQGITITNTSLEQTQVPENRTALASVQSAPLSAIMMFMLQHSDNTLAEEFGRLLAIKLGAQNSPEGATTAVRTVLHDLQINTDGLIMADCSGLSPGSRVSAHTLAQVQQRNLQVGGAVAAAEGLSVPGLVGTATQRLTSPNASGLMRVKTGSLGTVTSMAGNISRIQGGVLAFAVIINNPDDMEQARNAIDTYITALTQL